MTTRQTAETMSVRRSKYSSLSTTKPRAYRLPWKSSYYPMGIPAVCAQLMVIAAYALAILASWGCQFVEIDNFHLHELYGHDDHLEFANYAVDKHVTAIFDESKIHHLSMKVGVGLLSFEVGATQRCVAWSRSDAGLLQVGDAWKVASTCAWTGNILIGLSMFLSFCLTWFDFSLAWRMGLATMLMIGSLCEALTVVAFADDMCRGSSCQLSVNAVLSIAASIVAFVSAVKVLDLGSRMKACEQASELSLTTG